MKEIAYLRVISAMMLNGNAYDKSATLIEMAIQSVKSGNAVNAVITDVLCLDDKYIPTLKTLLK